MSSRAIGFAKYLAFALSLALVGAGTPPIAVIDVHGSPFMALPTPDGSMLLVSVTTPGFHRNEIAVYHRAQGVYTKGRSIPLEGTPAGLAVTPDGQTLLIADGDRYAAVPLDAARDDVPPIVASITAGSQPGAIEVTTSIDGRYAFFSNESASTVGVVRVEPAGSAHGAPKLALIGFVPVDRAPVGVAIAPDGKRLYVASEFSSGRPAACGDRGPGTLDVLDVAKAEVDPAHAVLSSTPAGCDPVRVAVSDDGSVVWVTVRGENRLVAYRVGTANDAALAPIAQVTVGSAPVGLLLLDDGRHVLVANSNRFDRDSDRSTLGVFDARAMLAGSTSAIATIPTGAFPRELRESPQHDAVYLTNYRGGTVEIISEPIVDAGTSSSAKPP